MTVVAHPATTREASVKGSILLALLDFIGKELTPPQRNELFNRIDPNRLILGSKPILPSDRIPLSLLNRLTTAGAEIKGEPLESWARRAGNAAAERSLAGVYRLFARILTPAFQLSKAAALWSSLYDRGRLEATPRGTTGATVKLLDLETEPAMCERIHGWLERMNQMTGVKNTRVVQTSCCSQGGDHCEWEITWS